MKVYSLKIDEEQYFHFGIVTGRKVPTVQDIQKYFNQHLQKDYDNIPNFKKRKQDR